MLSHGEESGRDSDEWSEARGEDGPHCPVSLMRKRGYRTFLTREKEKEDGGQMKYGQKETVEDEEMGMKEKASKKAARLRCRQDETGGTGEGEGRRSKVVSGKGVRK